jgi:hypothetical protein
VARVFNNNLAQQVGQGGSPDLPELKHCTKNWLSPKPMLQKLQPRGLNLLLSSSDCEMVTEKQPKVTVVEKWAYTDFS